MEINRKPVENGWIDGWMDGIIMPRTVTIQNTFGFSSEFRTLTFYSVCLVPSRSPPPKWIIHFIDSNYFCMQAFSIIFKRAKRERAKKIRQVNETIYKALRKNTLFFHSMLSQHSTSGGSSWWTLLMITKQPNIPFWHKINIPIEMNHSWNLLLWAKCDWFIDVTKSILFRALFSSSAAPAFLFCLFLRSSSSAQINRDGYKSSM